MLKSHYKENLEYGVHKRLSVTLPDNLIKKIDKLTKNRSAFISKACVNLVGHMEKRKLRQAMIERCKVRYQEDIEFADEFFAAEEEAWDNFLK